MRALLQTVGVSKHYGQGEGLVRAVDDVSVEVASGEFLSVMGPSGCGKSTLLYLMGGLETVSSGEIHLAGQRVDTLSQTAWARLRRHSVGFVFQAFHLVEELTAVENVELPALLAGSRPARARQRALSLLEKIGLADRARYLPSQLSGGQKQRVAVARALANEPLLVLADEPTGNLDTPAAAEVMRLFAMLKAAEQTLVLVTHDSRVAATADRLVSMRDGAVADETVLAGRNPLATLEQLL